MYTFETATYVIVSFVFKGRSKSVNKLINDV